MSSFRTQVSRCSSSSIAFFLSPIRAYAISIFLMSIHRPASQLLLSTASRSIRYSHKQSRHSVRYASTALPSSSVPLDEKLVRLARQTLSKAAAESNSSNNANGESNSHNDAETARKKKHIETLREALKEWQATTDVSTSFFFFFTHSPTTHVPGVPLWRYLLGYGTDTHSMYSLRVCIECSSDKVWKT